MLNAQSSAAVLGGIAAFSAYHAVPLHAACCWPQLVLRVFLALLPTILALLGRAEGLPAESEVEFTVVKRYYAFQVPDQAPGCACDTRKSLPGPPFIRSSCGHAGAGSS